MTQELAPTATDKLPQPNPAFTIPAKRLAGSDSCLNCGSTLHGPFCHYCGQPDRKFLRFFPVLVREMVSDAFDLDSRFLRTMKPLLFQPGKLTRDYLSGRRFRYTPPMRLYIFSSMAFFIVAALIAGSTIEIGADEESLDQARTAIEESNLSAEDRERIREALEGVEPGLGASVLGSLDEPEDAETGVPTTAPSDGSEATGEESAVTADSEEAAEHADDEIIIFGNEPWDRETNPVDIPFMPDFVNTWINDEIEESPQKGKEIEANPNLIVDKVFDVLPVTMFLLLPLVALILKFWYLFAKRYYIEHLIMALHNHAFLFVLFFISMMLETFIGWREPAEDGPLSTAGFWLDVVMMTWVPIYMFIAMKRVYQQGWLLTIAKYFVVSVSYLILLAFVTSITAVASFVLV